jgi:hypothetical protein
MPKSLGGLSPTAFLSKILYAVLIFSMCTTYPVRIIIHNDDSSTISDDEYKLKTLLFYPSLSLLGASNILSTLPHFMRMAEAIWQYNPYQQFVTILIIWQT